MKKSKKYILTSIFAASFCLSSGANADAGDTYAGFGLGNATADDSELDSALGWKLFGGYKINDNIAVEGGYTSFGEMDGPSVPGIFTSSLEATGFELAAVGSYPINDQFSLLGKLGFLAWDVDFTMNDTLFGSNYTASDSGTDIFFGLGGEYKLSDNVAIRAAWDRYTFDDGEIDLLSASAVYSF